MPGSLTIVGTGITMISQMTAEAQAWITNAEKTFFLVPHPLAEEWMGQLNPHAESLVRFYSRQSERREVYRDIVTHVFRAVQAGHTVCAAFYGHPSVFVTPTQDLVRRAQAEHYSVTVLPGISAEDCLFADLHLDPGSQGCQSYEATDFLLRPRRFDPCTPLILWQVGVIGYFKVVDATLDPAKGLAVLETMLLRSYPTDHHVIVYEAAMLPTSEPMITHVPLEGLRNAPITSLSTLYVPPIAPPRVDSRMLEQLGLTSV
jgi:uncharacterized protein YabN with tetrapyrrole methylase and pyrophosphatase domain